MTSRSSRREYATIRLPRRVFFPVCVLPSRHRPPSKLLAPLFLSRLLRSHRNLGNTPSPETGWHFSCPSGPLPPIREWCLSQHFPPGPLLKIKKGCMSLGVYEPCTGRNPKLFLPNPHRKETTAFALSSQPQSTKVSLLASALTSNPFIRNQLIWTSCQPPRRTSPPVTVSVTDYCLASLSHRLKPNISHHSPPSLDDFRLRTQQSRPNRIINDP